MLLTLPSELLFLIASSIDVLDSLLCTCKDILKYSVEWDELRDKIIPNFLQKLKWCTRTLDVNRIQLHIQFMRSQKMDHNQILYQFKHCSFLDGLPVVDCISINLLLQDIHKYFINETPGRYIITEKSTFSIYYGGYTWRIFIGKIPLQIQVRESEIIVINSNILLREIDNYWIWRDRILRWYI
jgi:hypothetical protein